MIMVAYNHRLFKQTLYKEPIAYDWKAYSLRLTLLSFAQGPSMKDVYTKL